MIPTIAKGNKGHNNQNDVDSNDRRVYRIDQQLEGGVETEAARPKVSYTAVACSSYAHMQPTPPEPHPETPHWRQAMTVEMTQHKKAKTHRFVKRPKDYYTDIKLRKDIEPGMGQPADGLTKAYQRTPIRHPRRVPVSPKIFWPT